VTLKSGLEIIESHWNWCHSKAAVSYSPILYRLRDIETYW